MRLVTTSCMACVVAILVGCGDASATGAGGSGGGTTGVGAGGDEITAPPCPPPRVPSPNGCVLPGVPDDGCGEGFAHDGDFGCEATLPNDCPPGQVALPGEMRCRPLAPCFDATWTGLPSEAGATTQHVDASYAGGAADGSLAAPWPTISEAIAAAEEGAVIAIAEGTYIEALQLDKAVKLWGQCPEKVTITSLSEATLIAAADDTEVHTLSVTGSGVGLGVLSAANVVVERVRVHDTGSAGLVVSDQLGPLPDVTITDSLVEAATAVGLVVDGGTVAIERTVVRDMAPDPATQAFGHGMLLNRSRFTAAATTVTIGRSVVEDVLEIGIGVAGADVTVDDTLVRRTGPQLSDLADGRGINVQPQLFSNLPDPFLSSLVLRGSVVEQSAGLGVAVLGSAAVVERTTVVDTTPRPADDNFGRGMEVSTVQYEMLDQPTLASLTMTGSLIDRSSDVALYLGGAEGLVESSAIRATATRASDDQFGDGLTAMASFGPTTATVRSTLVHANARAGLAAFGSSLSVEGSLMTCNGLALNAEAFQGLEASLSDGGDNTCGCDGAWDPCKVLSSALEPPLPSVSDL